MPRNRPSGVPPPDPFAPKSSRTTVAGSIIRARPVPNSTTAAKARIFLRELSLVALTATIRTVCPPRGSLAGPNLAGGSAARAYLSSLVSRSGHRLLYLLAVRFGQLLRPEVESQLVDLAVEAERHLVVLVVHP